MNVKQLDKAESRQFSLLKVKAGTYYIGDICYALNDDIYQKYWGNQFSFDSGLYDVDGKQFAVLPTAYGDGCYRGRGDNFDCDFPVDAGVIGLVDIRLVDKFDTNAPINFGKVVTFEQDIMFSYDFGTITILSKDFLVTIVTDDEYEEDDEWDDDEWDDMD